MAKHLRPTPRRVILRARFIGLFVAAIALLGLTGASTANAIGSRPQPAVVKHQAFYAHVSGNTYEIELRGWAPTTDVTFFKQKGSDPAYYEQPQSLTFSGNTTFKVGVNYGTVLEINVWNGRQTSYQFYLDTKTAPVASHASGSLSSAR